MRDYPIEFDEFEERRRLREKYVDQYLNEEDCILDIDSYIDQQIEYEKIDEIICGDS